MPRFFVESHSIREPEHNEMFYITSKKSLEGLQKNDIVALINPLYSLK